MEFRYYEMEHYNIKPDVLTRLNLCVTYNRDLAWRLANVGRNSERALHSN